MKCGIALLFIVFGGLATAEPITVRLANTAGVPDRILSHAEAVAGYILERTGIEVTWLACPELPECHRDPEAAGFPLQILKQRPAHLHGDTAGFAVIVPPPGTSRRYAGVFFPVVQDAARSLEANEAVLLGVTLVHEIGHLLLGSQAHSVQGVMAPHFGREHARLAGRGQLLFTPEQALQMQKEIRQRHAAAR